MPKYRKIYCPEPNDEYTFRADNLKSGDILECNDLATLFKRIAAEPLDGWNIIGIPNDERDDNEPENLVPYKVVLNRNVPFGATTGIAFGQEAAFELARNYWEQASTGHKVEIFVPPDSRDTADWKWVKGRDEGP